ncbi:MAG: hypothetical protein V4725_17300, partial [Bacteroidota bacterium]
KMIGGGSTVLMVWFLSGLKSQRHCNIRFKTVGIPGAGIAAEKYIKHDKKKFTGPLFDCPCLSSDGVRSEQGD